MSDPVIIIGAPRSGTNMLRDVLSKLPGFATWPCDEINFVWRHGNRDVSSDELERGHATTEVGSFLHRQFDKIGRKYDAHTVVEKTCANSLRVGFVAEVFPRARYIFIRRNGIDAAASAMKRWNAPFDLSYTVKKARYVPPSDVGYYGRQFILNRIQGQRPTMEGQASTGLANWWGPRPNDYADLQARHPLDEICMLQWQRCVDASSAGFAALPELSVHDVNYEEFVEQPALHLGKILAFLGRSDSMDESAVSGVSRHSVGKGRESLGPESVARLEELSQETLRKLGYA